MLTQNVEKRMDAAQGLLFATRHISSLQSIFSECLFTSTRAVGGRWDQTVTDKNPLSCPLRNLILALLSVS